MTIKAILFDCDGVLIDSEPMGCDALALAMSKAGVSMDRAEATRLFCGHPAGISRKIMSDLGVDGDSIYDESDRLLYEMFDQHIPLIEGIEGLLERTEFKVAVCSNSSVIRLQNSISKTHIAAHFGEHIYSGDTVPAPKPAPDLALFAAERLGVPASECIFIDDNIQGVKCGLDAGCISVGFVGASDHRPNHVQTLKDAGAHYVVRSMAEFEDLIASLNLQQSA